MRCCLMHKSARQIKAVPGSNSASSASGPTSVSLVTSCPSGLPPRARFNAWRSFSKGSGGTNSSGNRTVGSKICHRLVPESCKTKTSWVSKWRLNPREFPVCNRGLRAPESPAQLQGSYKTLPSGSQNLSIAFMRIVAPLLKTPASASPDSAFAAPELLLNFSPARVLPITSTASAGNCPASVSMSFASSRLEQLSIAIGFASLHDECRLLPILIEKVTSITRCDEIAEIEFGHHSSAIKRNRPNLLFASDANSITNGAVDGKT